MELSLNSLSMARPVSAVDLVENSASNAEYKQVVPNITVSYGRQGHEYSQPQQQQQQLHQYGNHQQANAIGGGGGVYTHGRTYMGPPVAYSSASSNYTNNQHHNMDYMDDDDDERKSVMSYSSYHDKSAYEHGSMTAPVTSAAAVNSRNIYKVPKKLESVSSKKKVEEELKMAGVKFQNIAGHEYKDRIKEIQASVNDTEEILKIKTMHSEYSQTLMRLKYSCYFPKEIKVIYDPIVYFTNNVNKGSKNEVCLCQNDRSGGIMFYGVPQTSNLTNTIVGEMNITYFNNPTNKTLGLLISNKIKNKKHYLTGNKYVDFNSTSRYHLIIPPKTKIINPVNIYRNVFNNSNDYCQLYTYLTPDPDSIDKDVFAGFLGEKLVPVDHPVYKYIVENAPLWENWEVPLPESKYNGTKVCIPGPFYEEVKDRLLEIIKIYYPVTNLSTLSFDFEVIKSTESDIVDVDDNRDFISGNNTSVEGMVQILFGFRR